MALDKAIESGKEHRKQYIVDVKQLMYAADVTVAACGVREIESTRLRNESL